MCGSIADIQSITAEIRRGNKEVRRQNKRQDENIIACPILYGGHNDTEFNAQSKILRIRQHCLQVRAWVDILHPTRHKIGHFGDILPSQSLGLVLNKLKLTQLEYGPMPNVMAALPNIGGTLCATKQFGWRPLLECCAVTLPRRKTRRNL